LRFHRSIHFFSVFHTMHRATTIGLLASFIFLTACAPEPSEEASGPVPNIVIALEPDKDPDAMIADRDALQTYLEDATERSIEAIIPLSSAVIHEGLRNGTIDLAFLSATAAARLVDSGAVDLLLATLIEGRPSYLSYWITRRDAPYQSVEDLEGKAIAFSSRTSTSGFLIPTWDLYTQGLIDLQEGPEGFFGPGNVYYGVGYVSAAERVLEGSAEAAAVSYYVLDEDKHLSREQRAQLRRLDTQGPVPSHVIVVRSDLGEAEKDALQAALLEMNKEAVSLRNRIFGYELAPADADAHLATIREALELNRNMNF
jgi:phosphonate transport system substrate-binding protein